MSATMKLSILCPERRLVEGISVESVLLTGSEGQLQILPGHAPMVGTLEAGMFSFSVPGEAETIGVISSGFFEILDERVVVMADTLELKQEINVERARKAQQLAEQALKDADLDEHRFKEYQLMIQRSMIRQQVAGKEH